MRGSVLNTIPNCKRFSHNIGVNEAEPSIGVDSGSQVGNLLVSLSREDSELVLILMNNNPVTQPCLDHSLQRLQQVTDATAPCLTEMASSFRHWLF